MAASLVAGFSGTVRREELSGRAFFCGQMASRMARKVVRQQYLMGVLYQLPGKGTMGNLATSELGYALKSMPFLAQEQCRQVVSQVVRREICLSFALHRQLGRLASLYASYLERYPFGVWGPGLLVTTEMHRQTELYLPLAAIWPGWRQTLEAGLAVRQPDRGDEFLAAPSWLAILERLALPIPVAPHRLLQEVMTDAEMRECFLFAWQLPRHHGGGFDRYPEQRAWLADWLAARRPAGGAIACLDAACGSGEGTYELAAALMQAGHAPEQVAVHGVTLQPLEVVAAAMAYFPHDRGRQVAYRARLAGMLSPEFIGRIDFRLGNLLGGLPTGQAYDVILCNGLLGGPMLHGRQQGERVMRGLASRLAPGGILLADDQFHAGWRKRVPHVEMQCWLQAAGLQPLTLPRGIGGVACR